MPEIMKTNLWKVCIFKKAPKHHMQLTRLKKFSMPIGEHKVRLFPCRNDLQPRL